MCGESRYLIFVWDFEMYIIKKLDVITLLIIIIY